ncbi:hypothetical protein PIB30_105819 [Stylosanthes scabra]|uniref:Uncharacterized protein n=1 Tax=Stylosanthes scabra TaxID=79078 RepID=A0ABU6WWX4_9FABA|nr:hypothetical protein [Stylosanthes scabra]
MLMHQVPGILAADRHPRLKAFPLHSREFSYPYAYMCLGFSECRYYLHFVAAASTTIFIRENENEGEGFVLCFRLGGREFKFTLEVLAAAWGLRNDGDTFKGGNHPLRTWNEFSKATAVRELRLEQAAPEQSWYRYRGRPSDPMGNRNEKRIHWPYLMANRLLPLLTRQALAHLWTGLFELAPLDLSREEVVNPGSTNIITSRHINQMQRNLDNQADVAEGVGEEVAEDMPMPDTQPQPTAGTSSQVPTGTADQSEVIEFMRNGFEGMRVTLSNMYTGLSNRIDGLEAHMTSQDADIRGLRDELHSLKGEDVTMDPPEQQDDAPAQD